MEGESKEGAESPNTERERIKDNAVELYDKSQEFVAPVIVSFANHLLELASDKEGKAKVVFLARDALGTFTAAKALLKKFPDQYPGVTEDCLKYAYITRKTAWNSSHELLGRYFKELGIEEDDELTVADIGMYGAVIPELQKKIPNHNFARFEYLISRTSMANGFLDNGRDKKLEVFQQISGNPAVHFMEDTFSGPIHSPSKLVEGPGGKLVPNTIDEGYPPEIALRRKVALDAIEDYVSMMDKVGFPKDIGLRLNEFLSNQDNYKAIVVSHER